VIGRRSLRAEVRPIAMMSCSGAPTITLFAYGQIPAARRARGRAVTLADRCEGARTPVIRTMLTSHGTVLTEREREIAGLAAKGLTNRQIAALLFLSIRTVGNHLNHVYAKLGIATRTELAALLE
jgi:DNA-binding CsgD family transcriptional regulator